VLYALLGVLASIVGLIFVRVLYGGEDVADRIWARLRWPEWLRPGVGGILLGLLLLAVPEMYGVGYPVLIKGVSATTCCSPWSASCSPRSWPPA